MKKEQTSVKPNQPSCESEQSPKEEWAPATLIDVDFPLFGTRPRAQSSPAAKTPVPAAPGLPFHPVSLPFSLSEKQEPIATPEPLPAAFSRAPVANSQRQHLEQTPAALPGRHATVLPKVTFNDGRVVLTPQHKDRYRPLSQLGEGGAGEVVLVEDNDIHRRVAMKRVKAGLQGNEHLARFVEEIKTVGQLEHPNIAPLHDVGIDKTGQHYFTMKYVEGETLSEIIDKLNAGIPEYHKRYTYERRTQIFVEILQAVRFAHDKTIIHRDLKPENVMIGKYGEIQVMDWGLAKKKPSAKQTSEGSEALTVSTDVDSQRPFETGHGELLGTPAYMSPEQAAGLNDELDERSDVYSLCVLFYEFLNLRHPLAHKQGIQDLLWGILDEEPIDSEKLSNPHQGPVPRELCFFLRKGLKKNRQQRFQSTDEMIEELQANLEGRICVYCPSTFLKRTSHGYGHYLDNHRVLGVVFFVLVLGVLGVGCWQSVKMLIAAFG